MTYAHEEATNYLNNCISNGTSAKALLIGPNQCGKTNLCYEFSKSLKGLTTSFSVTANDFNDSQKENNNESGDQNDPMAQLLNEFSKLAKKEIIRTNDLANTVNDFFELMKKNNIKGQKINFVLHIDEFDNKASQSFNPNITVFTEKIFNAIIDNPNKPTWFTPHLLITANNERVFAEARRYIDGKSNDAFILFTRIPQTFKFTRFTIDEAKAIVTTKLNELNVTNEEIKNRINVQLNNRSQGNQESQRVSTLTIREIFDVINENIKSNNIEINRISPTNTERNKV